MELIAFIELRERSHCGSSYDVDRTGQIREAGKSRVGASTNIITAGQVGLGVLGVVPFVSTVIGAPADTLLAVGGSAAHGRWANEEDQGLAMVELVEVEAHGGLSVVHFIVRRPVHRGNVVVGLHLVGDGLRQHHPFAIQEDLQVAVNVNVQLVLAGQLQFDILGVPAGVHHEGELLAHPPAVDLHVDQRVHLRIDHTCVRMYVGGTVRRALREVEVGIALLHFPDNGIRIVGFRTHAGNIEATQGIRHGGGINRGQHQREAPIFAEIRTGQGPGRVEGDIRYRIPL